MSSYPDYLLRFSLLLRDPLYYGLGVPRGTGQPILLIPGFLVGDWSLQVMAGWLRRMGYRPYLSGIDWNVSPPARMGAAQFYLSSHGLADLHGISQEELAGS
jgi:hypothetical protein